MKFKKILIAIIVVFLILIAVYATRVQNPQVTPPVQQVACTMEARLCPDGSYVGRSGPLCEFAECPDANAGPLESFNDEARGISFNYQKTLSTTYITAVDWPPMLQIVKGPFSCLEAGDVSARAGKTEKRSINGREYCVTVQGEGAAGSTYLQYAYAFPVDDQVGILTFSTRETQCANYDEPKQAECQTERATFNVDSVVDRIVRTLVIAS